MKRKEGKKEGRKEGRKEGGKKKRKKKERKKGEITIFSNHSRITNYLIPLLKNSFVILSNWRINILHVTFSESLMIKTCVLLVQTPCILRLKFPCFY